MFLRKRTILTLAFLLTSSVLAMAATDLTAIRDQGKGTFNGTNLKSRPLTVNEARPRTDRPRTG